MQIAAFFAVLVLGAQAAEIAIYDKCTLCDVAAPYLPGLDVDKWGDTLCPGDDLVHVPGTLDCEMTNTPVIP